MTFSLSWFQVTVHACSSAVTPICLAFPKNANYSERERGKLINWGGLGRSLEFCSWAVKPCITEKRLALQLKWLLAPLNLLCWSFNLGHDKAEIIADHVYSPLRPTLRNQSRFSHSGCSVLPLAFVSALLSLQRLFTDFTHTVTEWRVVLPHWWAEPETLVASLWLSLSCWRPAGWVDCSGSSPATGSWGAPQTQRSCKLLIQMSRCLFFHNLHQETKLILLVWLHLLSESLFGFFCD